jgi:dolichyl-phosphate-mannose--protein O-mannosyl transferase
VSQYHISSFFFAFFSLLLSSMLRLPQSPDKKRALLFFILVTAIGFFTYVQRYNQPAAFFWDENYHIASAQKYLNGVYFMEQHPPLGKLLIAAGELLLNRNALDNQFIGTDYGTDLPAGFSFAGYRLFPVLLAWLTAPLLFLIFWKLTKSDIASALLSSFYLFDNALIVHLRGAMLEPTLLFFSALNILAFLLLRNEQNAKRFGWYAALFGASFGFVLTTKVVGLVMILLIPALIFLLWPKKDLIQKFVGIGALAFLVSFVSVWQTHFALGSTINPLLPDQGYYQASEQYKAVLTAGKNRSLRWFPVMLKDSLNFVSHYNNGVPRLDLCKEEENGSPWFLWPIGGRSISYRWETPDGGLYQYLYLQVNPAVWWIAFAGVIAAVGLLLSSFVMDLKSPLRDRPLLLIFTGLYLSYMAAISQISRVMYLYHYFLPLLFSFCVLALVLMEIQRIGRWTVTTNRRLGAFMVLALVIFASYEFYRPLSNYEPISDGAFARRVLTELWDLHCVHCAKTSPFVQKP